MSLIMILQYGRGPGKHTPACDNPNPPPWCPDYEPATTIASWSYYIAIGIFIVALIYFLYVACLAFNEYYLKPKRQKKWLEKKYSEKENNSN
jgi:hypothetical protein